MMFNNSLLLTVSKILWYNDYIIQQDMQNTQHEVGKRTQYSKTHYIDFNLLKMAKMH